MFYAVSLSWELTSLPDGQPNKNTPRHLDELITTLLHLLSACDQKLHWPSQPIPNHTQLVCLPQSVPGGPGWRCRTLRRRQRCQLHPSLASADAGCPGSYWSVDPGRQIIDISHDYENNDSEIIIIYKSVPSHVRLCCLSDRKDTMALCCLSVSTLLSRGSLTWTPALSPVPRLDGQVRM